MEKAVNNRLSADQDYNLWVLLHQTKDVIYKARDQELRQYDLSPIQAAVLFIIEAIGGKSTPTEISKWMLREPHSVSSLLDRMENDDLVSKSPNLTKKRQINVTITKKGQQAYRQSLKRESIRDIMSCLSKEEREQLESTLVKLRKRALQSITQEIKPPFP